MWNESEFNLFSIVYVFSVNFQGVFTHFCLQSYGVLWKKRKITQILLQK